MLSLLTIVVEAAIVLKGASEGDKQLAPTWQHGSYPFNRRIGLK